MGQDERKILDSGARREFPSGAIRDIAEGKGRLDLLPLSVIADVAACNKVPNLPATLENFSLPLVFSEMDQFMQTGDINHIIYILCKFVSHRYHGSIETAVLDLSIQYEEGAKKYSERNWERGINCHCFVDSSLRHCLKFLRGDKDEPHDRAFMWNLCGLLWTLENKPELNDLPFASSNN